MKFEFDPWKNEENTSKHKVSFEEASQTFRDEFFLSIPAKKRGEKRMLGLGSLDDLVIATIYTIRNDSVRIISARVATEEERKFYYGKIK